MGTYDQDRKRVDPLMAQVRTILSQLPLAYFAEVREAPIERDMKHATDLVLRITGGDIAVRLRFPPCGFRDLTIRAQRDTGAKTELAKIREGFAYRYFYGWIGRSNTIDEWMLADLDKARETGLLKKERPLIPNKGPDGKPDGTYFISITIKELQEAGCLIMRYPDVSRPKGGRPLEGYRRQMESTKKLTDQEIAIIRGFSYAGGELYDD